MAHLRLNKDSVIESARQFGDDLQELIAAIENNDSTVGLAHCAMLCRKKPQRRQMVMNKSIPVLAIDGPSGSGKGTLAARMAAELGWHLLDSGPCTALLLQWPCDAAWMLSKSKPCAIGSIFGYRVPDGRVRVHELTLLTKFVPKI